MTQEYKYYIAGELFKAVLPVSRVPSFDSVDEAKDFYEKTKQFTQHYNYNKYKKLCIVRKPIYDYEILEKL
jgi:hypothetical protein